MGARARAAPQSLRLCLYSTISLDHSFKRSNCLRNGLRLVKDIGEQQVLKVINAWAFRNYWGNVHGLPPPLSLRLLSQMRSSWTTFCNRTFQDSALLTYTIIIEKPFRDILRSIIGLHALCLVVRPSSRDLLLIIDNVD